MTIRCVNDGAGGPMTGAPVERRLHGMHNEAIHPAVRVAEPPPPGHTGLQWFDRDGRPVLKADRFDHHELLTS